MRLSPARASSSAALVAAHVDERNAFEELYREHKSYVWNTLRRLGVHERDRADLLHDVFVVLWKRSKDLREGSPVRPWLFGITYRVVLHHRRWFLRRREDFQEDIDVAVAPLQDEVIDKQRARRLLSRALAAMDIEQRAVFVLHDIDGENIAACARAFDVSVNTLYSRLRLARKKLAGVVEEARGDKDGGP